jgi:3-methyladenine DNA glycosylase AlkC
MIEMKVTTNNLPRILTAPKAIQKDVPLKDLLGLEAIEHLAQNILLVHPQFPATSFQKMAWNGLEPLGIMERGQHLAKALRQHLPQNYTAAIEIILASLTPPLEHTEDNGLATFFYLPHSYFVAMFGLDPKENAGADPFEISMQAQYEITQRFTAEFSIRPFLIQQKERTLAQLMDWTVDRNPHVRRLCSEGTRSRLPWGIRIPAFITNPAPVFPILEALKCDESLYVRRSVANNLGDIAKDHPEQVFAICDRWLKTATPEIKWLIRHALRHPAKKGDKVALQLRTAAK